MFPFKTTSPPVVPVCCDQFDRVFLTKEQKQLLELLTEDGVLLNHLIHEVASKSEAALTKKLTRKFYVLVLLFAFFGISTYFGLDGRITSLLTGVVNDVVKEEQDRIVRTKAKMYALAEETTELSLEMKTSTENAKKLLGNLNEETKTTLAAFEELTGSHEWQTADLVKYITDLPEQNNGDNSNLLVTLTEKVKKIEKNKNVFHGDVTIKGNLTIEPGVDSRNMIAKLRVGTDDKNIEIFSRSVGADMIKFTRNFGTRKRSMLNLEDEWNPVEPRNDLKN